VGYKSILRELLWFLRGDTDANKLAQEGVHIWDKNTSREFLDKTGLYDYKEGDIGPMYGWIWRHVSAAYKGCDYDYTGEGIDQLENVVHTLKTDPFSRRILLTTYNVSDAGKGCLYPCHGNIVQFNCEEHEGKKYLSCHMYQRSCDVFLGFPFNIASYAALTYIIAMKTDMVPKDLVISLGDTHIYNNLLQQTEQQISRAPFPFPVLKVSQTVKEKKWEELTVDDFELIGYHHHPAIKGEMSV
jgi:thymidylate synthase